ncbi:hypothetical protein PFBG_04343 [Plasmodium falciparum 7G8]|uniref:FHA domain-containing protein n=1 Tax=Plasmodium falciparum (isolate 7G8) TaxID=57266 RepID=W7FHE3_PLAF8|nr:hypothetical protein PFBG_04343 [Plasmodium falciparum 7G8]
MDKIYILKKSSEHTRTSKDNSYYDSKRKYRNITSEDEEMKHHKTVDHNARKKSKSSKILVDKYSSYVENDKKGVEEKYKDKNKNSYQTLKKNDNNINEKEYDKNRSSISHYHNKDKYNKYDKYGKQNHNIRYNEQDIKRKSTKHYEKENFNNTHKGKNKNEKDEEQSEEEKEKKNVQKKETQNFNPSGLLAQEKIYKNGIEMKYTESIDAEKPDKKWRLYMFKDSNNNEPQKILHIHDKSYYLIGKEQLAVDIQLNNISISKQHAVIQFKKHESKILPFLLDLNSTNGTYINNEKIQPNKYYELRETDIIRFGSSNREFVLLHDTCQAD